MLNLTNHITVPPDPVSHSRRPFLTPIPGEPGNFLLVLDNTSLEHIKRCHKNAEFYLVRGREAHARNAALTFGGAIHEGLELFHNYQYNLMANRHGVVNEELYGNKAQDAAMLRYFSENPIPPDILQYDHRTPAAALEVLRHYRRRCDPELHPDYEWDILADASGPIIERSFELPMSVLEVNTWISNSILKIDTKGQYIQPITVPNIFVEKIHLAWSGRIDLLALCNGQPRVVDHKTSSIDTADYFRSFELSSQVRGYVWAAQQLWPEINPKAFCHNGIFFKKPNKSASPTSSLLLQGSKGGSPPLDFRRTYYPSNTSGEYSPADISRWLRDTVLLIEDFLHSVSRSVFPMNDANCVVKYGICPYHDVCCLQNEAVGINYLNSPAYKTVTWNPTNPR